MSSHHGRTPGNPVTRRADVRRWVAVVSIVATATLAVPPVSGAAPAAADPAGGDSVQVARERRVGLTDRVASLEAELAAARGRLTELASLDGVLLRELTEARRTMREYAIEAYLRHDRDEWLAVPGDPEHLAQYIWISEVLSARTDAAAEAAADFAAIRDGMSPDIVAAVEHLDELTAAVADARDGLLQAEALERDAEAVESQQRARAAAEAAAAAVAPAAADAAVGPDSTGSDTVGTQPTTPATTARRQAPTATARPSTTRPAPATTRPAPSTTRRAPATTAPTTTVPPAPAPTPTGPVPTASEAAYLARVRACESSGNYRAVSGSGRYRGAYQFDSRTWATVGGSGDAAQASPAEQDLRALMLLRSRGTRPWPKCSR